jgi:hypothetical protein
MSAQTEATSIHISGVHHFEIIHGANALAYQSGTVLMAWPREGERKQARNSFESRPPVTQRSLLPSSNPESRYKQLQFTTIRMSVPIIQTSIESIPTVSQCSAHTASFFQHPSNFECLMVRSPNATQRDRERDEFESYT